MGVLIRKEIGIGFLVGLISLSFGCALVVLTLAFVKGTAFTETFYMLYEANSLWMCISLGALLNFLPFFGFLRIKRLYRARGVLFSTIIAAVVTYLLYFSSY